MSATLGNKEFFKNIPQIKFEGQIRITRLPFAGMMKIKWSGERK
jgi:hypothetical protein